VIGRKLFNTQLSLTAEAHSREKKNFPQICADKKRALIFADFFFTRETNSICAFSGTYAEASAQALWILRALFFLTDTPDVHR
jgi:hypothetical protein